MERALRAASVSAGRAEDMKKTDSCYGLTPLLVGCGLVYLATFAVVHAVPGLRKAALDGDWYYSDIPLLASAEFYGFWGPRQLAYRATGATSRHISERLPLGLPDGLLVGQ